MAGLVAAVFAAVLFSACGGGGGGISADTPSEPDGNLQAQARAAIATSGDLDEKTFNLASALNRLGGSEDNRTALQQLEEDMAAQLSVLDTASITDIVAVLSELQNALDDFQRRLEEIRTDIEKLCPPDSPILSREFCRPRISEDCAGAVPVLDAVSGECRARVASDCTGALPVLDAASRQCRARVASDCTGALPVLDAANRQCRARVAGDCTGAQPEFNPLTRECRERVAGDCSGVLPEFNPLTRECRERVAGDCTGAQPEFNPATKECRERVAGDCAGGALPEFSPATKECRARVAGDCAGGVLPEFNPATKECRERVASDCAGGVLPEFNPATKECRERVAGDCTGGALPEFNPATKECRERVAGDCAGALPEFNPLTKECRERAAGDCTGAQPEFNPATKECRERAAGDCTDDKPELDAGNGECRARVASDCTGGALPEFNPITKECRERMASDCTGGALPEFNPLTRECRERVAGDCFGALPEFNPATKECRERVAGDCAGGVLPEFNPITKECRERVAGDCAGGALPEFNSITKECRERVAGDCAGGVLPEFNPLTKECRERVAGDCAGGALPEFNPATKECRERVAGDCAGGVLPEFNPLTKECRERVAGDCAGGALPEFNPATKECRERMASDCVGALPEFNPITKECRERVAGDCAGGALPEFNPATKECRERMASDCTGALPVLDAITKECRAASGELQWTLAPQEGCAAGQVRIGIGCYNEGEVGRILEAEEESRIAFCIDIVLQSDFHTAFGARRICNRSIPSRTQDIMNFLQEDKNIRNSLSDTTYYSSTQGFGRYLEYQQSVAAAAGLLDPCDHNLGVFLDISGCESYTEEFRRSHGLAWMRAEEAYKKGYFGQGVTVAVLDTGVRISHEDLRDNMVVGYDFRFEKEPGPGNRLETDNDGHGTAVAGIVAAVRGNGKGAHGVAPQAKIMPLYLGTEYLHDNVRYAVENGAKIISNSWTFSLIPHTSFNVVFEGNEYTVWIATEVLTRERNMINIRDETKNIIIDNDAVLVWGAGNGLGRRGNFKFITVCPRDGGECRRGDHSRNLERHELEDAFGFTYEAFAAGVSITHRGGNAFSLADLNIPDRNASHSHGYHEQAPTVHPDIMKNWLVVTGLGYPFQRDILGNPVIADFSNGCGQGTLWCITAPAASSYTTSSNSDSSYRDGSTDDNGFFSGTSAATPYVSGALAVLQSAATEMPMTMIRNIMLTTATDLGLPGRDDNYGWGLVNISAGIALIESMETARTSQFAAVPYSALRGVLPAQFSHLRGHLANAEIAIHITSGMYYNMPLSRMFSAAAENTAPEMGEAAAKMLSEIPESKAAKGFFAFGASQNEFGVRWRGKTGGLRFFRGFQELGFLPNGADIMAEMSHAAADGAFSGAHLGALGAASGSSNGGKIRLGGNIKGNLSAFGEYEYRDIKAGITGGLLQTEIRNAESSGWTAGMEYADIWLRGSRLRLSAQRRANLSGGEMVLHYPKAEGDFHTAFIGEGTQTLKTAATAIPLARRAPILWTIGYAVEADGGGEWSAALEYDTGSKKSALSAKWRLEF